MGGGWGVAQCHCPSSSSPCHARVCVTDCVVLVVVLVVVVVVDWVDSLPVPPPSESPAPPVPMPRIGSRGRGSGGAVGWLGGWQGAHQPASGPGWCIMVPGPGTGCPCILGSVYPLPASIPMGRVIRRVIRVVS